MRKSPRTLLVDFLRCKGPCAVLVRVSLDQSSMTPASGAPVERQANFYLNFVILTKVRTQSQAAETPVTLDPDFRQDDGEGEGADGGMLSLPFRAH